jgi:hypothetical protein
VEFRSGGSWVERRLKSRPGSPSSFAWLLTSEPDTAVAHVMYVLAAWPGPDSASASSTPAAESTGDGHTGKALGKEQKLLLRAGFERGAGVDRAAAS